jgi:hypothetical protein
LSWSEAIPSVSLGAVVGEPPHALDELGKPLVDVSEPDLGNEVDRVRGPQVLDRYADEHVVDVGLRIFDGDAEVPIVVEDAGIEDRGRRALPARFGRALSELLVGKPRMRVLVEREGICVRRDRVESRAWLQRRYGSMK